MFYQIYYCTDVSFGLIYYKNHSLRGDKYICEVLKLHNQYTSVLFLDHHPNNLPTLEEITTF